MGASAKRGVERRGAATPVMHLRVLGQRVTSYLPGVPVTFIEVFGSMLVDTGCRNRILIDQFVGSTIMNSPCRWGSLHLLAKLGNMCLYVVDMLFF